MPVLLPTGHFGTAVWLGRVPLAKPPQLASTPEARLMLRFSGVEGEAHSGLTRPACSRVAQQYARGTPIANTRQLTLMAAEDLAAMAAAMGIAALDPGLMGASVVLEGIADFCHLPPGSRLQADSGATLVVDMENRPCKLPSRGIEALHPGKGALLLAAARGRRGITAWVEAEGVLELGARLRLHVPDQPVWAHLGAARRG